MWNHFRKRSGGGRPRLSSRKPPGRDRVSLDWDCPRCRYRVEETERRTIYYASGYPRSLPGLPRERNLNGISFAVADMTGFVIRARESVPADATSAALAAETARGC